MTMGLLAVAGAFAPAALAEETVRPADTTTPPSEEESIPAPAILTPSPAPAAASTPGAHFGTGKLTVRLEAPEGSVPDREYLDPTGAQVELSFGTLRGELSDLSATCTFEAGTGCVFPREAGIPRSGWDATSPYLPADSVFTLTLVKPPTSGQLLLLPGSPAVTQGHTTETTDSMPGSYVTVPVMAESGYRTLGVTVNGEEPLAGSTFDLCTIAGSDCAADEIVPEITVGVLTATAGVVTATTDQVGTATFPGRYLPGTYTVVQTAAPAGQSFDPSPHTLLVEAAESLTERNTPVRLTLGEPVTPPVPTPTPPVSTPPVSTPPVRTPPLPTPPTSTPTGEAPVPGTPVRSTPVTSAPPTPSVAWQTITPGKQQTVVLGGFQPFETVHGVLHSTPVDLGTAQADAAGFATFTFTIPAGLEVGAHNVTMTGLTSGATAQADFTVTAAAAQDTSGLAYTGTDVLPLLALGGGLLVAGAGAVTVAARRRSA